MAEPPKLTAVNLTPSKQTNPAEVPTQRKPSRVCTIAVTESDGSASSWCQMRSVPAVSAKSKSAPPAQSKNKASPTQQASR